MREAIRAAWCRETSYYPFRWTEDNPALGQCAVTAALVHELLGGEIWRCVPLTPGNNGDNHYFNVLGNERIDLTASQFATDENPLGLGEADYLNRASLVLGVESLRQGLGPRLSLLRQRLIRRLVDNAFAERLPSWTP